MFESLIQWMFATGTYNDIAVYLLLTTVFGIVYLLFFKE